jgi:hypothetical protein
VQLVHAFETVFVPIGVLANAISPFVDTALYLITMGVSLASNAAMACDETYHCEYKGHGTDRHWGEMFLELHAVVVLVLEP